MATIELLASTTLTISSGQTDSSDSVRTGRWTQFQLKMSAGFDGSNLRFSVSFDDVNYQIWDNTMVVGANQNYLLPDGLARWPYFKLSAGTTQSANRTFTLSASG